MASRPRPGQLQRILDVVGAATAALLAFTAVPIVLIVTVGNPLAGGLGHAWHPLQRDTLCLLVLAAWVAWVACCAQLLRAVVTHVRAGGVGARHGWSVLDRVAARIAFGVLAITSVGAPLALSVNAGASTPAGSTTHSMMAGATAAPVALADRDDRADARSSQRAPAAAYTVQPGDTLWGIADRYLADGADWSAIAALNLGRHVEGGARFVDPDRIRTGWHLELPGQVPRAAARGGQADDAAHALPRAPSGHLPELIALGLGSLACAALARRAGQRRRGSRFTGDPFDQHVLSDGAQDAATLLCRFRGVPALQSFETANCLLAATLDGRSGVPEVRAICVSEFGVTFCFADAPSDEPPFPFACKKGGTAWHVSHDALDGVGPTFPHLPLVVPVGDNDEGTWLIPLGPGSVLPLLGESAPALCRSARAAVAAWAWSEMLVVTDDPHDATLVAELAADPLVARHILFCGDPAALEPRFAARCAVITTEPVSATDLTVLVDRQAATLHPMGEVVRPHLQSMEAAVHIEELVAAVADPGDDAQQFSPVDVAPGAAAAAAALAPGTVDVRLLTMTPRLDGLQEELPPNRARRAVELVAYLALHQPDAITSDRLRTRVLGSSDADAASKTLFNTAYAARRAMGVDEHGDPLLPAGTRLGQYQISPKVSTDVQRAIALAGEAQRQSDPAAVIACARAALSLVEGEPLANALSGYTWWEGEGHGGRIAAVLVNTACTMASLASDTGHFDLARWGLEQARLVEPYSEALSRAAMEVAAAEGDADRLRAEWRECQRRVDALDPGCSPSARTESLYGELAHRVSVGTRPHRTRHDIGDARYDEAPLSSS